MKLARSTFAVGILIVLLGFGVYLVRDGREGRTQSSLAPEVSEPTVVPSDVSTDLVEPATEIAAAGVVEESRVALESEIEESGPAPTSLPAGSSGRTLRGRVVFTDRQGVEHANASGRFALVVWRGESGHHVDVEFVEGSWTAAGSSLEGADRYSVFDVDVFGEPKVYLSDPELAHPGTSDDPFVIRVFAAPKSSLKVVQEGSGNDLSGISLVRCDGSYDEHPGLQFAERVVVSDLRSPIDLTVHAETLEEFGNSEFLVGASGHAWKLVKFDFRAGGERLVVLAPSAGLSVSVQGVRGDDHVRLRLHREVPGSPILDVPLSEDGVIPIADLEPGPIMIQAAVGDWWKDPVVLAASEAVLAAGDVQHVALVLERAPLLETAVANGFILIDESWGVSSITPELEFLGTTLGGREWYRTLTARMVPSPRPGFTAFAWQADDLQVGRYELEISEPAISTAFDLPVHGLADFEWRIGPPRQLLLRVLNSRTGEEVISEGCKWYAERPEGVEGGTLETASFDSERGGYPLRTPAERVVVMIWSWPYQPFSEVIDLSGGVRQHTIRLEPACGVTLVVRDGETPVPFPEDWHGDPSMTDGEGRTTLARLGQYERKYMVSEPGTYTIELPNFEGYERVENPRIHIADGEFTEVIVRLERE